MSEATVPQTVTIPAVPRQVRVARAFVAGVLGECHPHVDVALLLASELVSNSVMHSGSAVPGGLVTVTVAAGAEGVRVEVTDRSGDGVPVLQPAAGARQSAAGGCGSWTTWPRGGVTSGAAVSPRRGSSWPRTEPGWLTWHVRLRRTRRRPGAECMEMPRVPDAEHSGGAAMLRPFASTHGWAPSGMRPVTLTATCSSSLLQVDGQAVAPCLLPALMPGFVS